jgi:PLD-like domain
VVLGHRKQFVAGQAASFGFAQQRRGRCWLAGGGGHRQPQPIAHHVTSRELCRQLGRGDRAASCPAEQHLPDVRGVDDGIQALVTRSTAQKGSTDAEQLFYTAIVCARERIWLTTAYFAPRCAFVDALCDAVRRGVDVPVLTSGPHTDKQVVRQAGRRCYEQLLAGGGRILEYQHTMLHAKVLLEDAHWVTVGSVNFDNLARPPHRHALPRADRRARAKGAIANRLPHTTQMESVAAMRKVASEVNNVENPPG